MKHNSGLIGTLLTDPARLRRIVNTYSDHIGLPIVLKASSKEETINTASALWTRPRSEITREQYEQLIQPVIDRTVGPCKQAMKDAGLRPEQIDEVVLVGGSTRIPKVRALVKEMFHREPHTDLNPDEVVALGAAVQANILGGGSEATENMLLLDVTPLSLGIEVAGGVTDKIILRNSTIPASATQFYTTQIDGQANVAIHVLQGERELANDCRSLARFDLKGIPPMAAGMARIEVKFLIDANGILNVAAREQRSGKEAEIQVQPSYGLTDEQVESMILDSFDSAEEDFRQRQVIEARNEAETILSALEKGYEDLFALKKKATHPLTLLRSIASSAAAHVSIDHGIRGPVFGTVSACSTAAHAIGLAFQLIRSGAVDVAAAGASEAAITFGSMRAWQALRSIPPGRRYAAAEVLFLPSTSPNT